MDLFYPFKGLACFASNRESLKDKRLGEGGTQTLIEHYFT